VALSKKDAVCKRRREDQRKGLQVLFSALWIWHGPLPFGAEISSAIDSIARERERALGCFFPRDERAR
jgi:hypothetical protein